MAGRKPTKPDSSSQDQQQIGEMKATLDYLKGDFSLMREELKVMNQTLAVNTKQLEIHIEGVKLAREQNDLLRKEIDERLKPMETRHIQAKAVAWTITKITAALVAIPAILAGIYEAYKFLETYFGK